MLKIIENYEGRKPKKGVQFLFLDYRIDRYKMVNMAGPSGDSNCTKADPWAGDQEKPENKGIVEFLRSMPQDEVMALVRTITAGLVATQDLDGEDVLLKSCTEMLGIL